MKCHNKEFFYQYVCSEVAISILEKCALKWSNPIGFNDPFDIREELNFPFNENEFFEFYKSRNIELFYNDIPVPGGSEFWIRMRNTRSLMSKSESKFVHEGFFNSIREKVILDHKNNYQQFCEQWKRHISNFRVLCLTENSDDLLMWAHYASKHTGVMFKFKCLDSQNSHFKDVRPVIYSLEPPFIATLEEWINNLIGVSVLDSKATTYKILSTKGINWSYEKEWRAIVEYPGYDFFNLMPEEIDSIYFGCKIDEERRKEIFELVKSKFNHIKIYESSKDPRAYRLIYTQV